MGKGIIFLGLLVFIFAAIGIFYIYNGDDTQPSDEADISLEEAGNNEIIIIQENEEPARKMKLDIDKIEKKCNSGIIKCTSAGCKEEC